MTKITKQDIERLLESATKDLNELIKWLQDKHPDIWQEYRKDKKLNWDVSFA